MQATKAKEAEEGTEFSLWFPRETLGVLEHLVTEAINHSSKKQRASNFKRIISVLKGLRLISKEIIIKRVAMGCNPLGEVGLLLSARHPIEYRGASMPGNYAEERTVKKGD